jgi:hypothetical protein
MRILVTGSRDWLNPFVISYAIEEVLWPYFNLPLPSGVDGDKSPVIGHGACPTGADYFANMYAEWKGYEVEKYPAEWKIFGKAAGPIRNQVMVDSGADVVLAFKNPDSRGTQDCINRAKKAGLKVIEYNPQGEYK